MGEITINRRSKGFYDLEIFGYTFTVTREMRNEWHVVRLDGGEWVQVAEVRLRNLAFHAALDNALMCFRQDVMVDAIEKIDEEDYGKLGVVR